MLNIKNGKPRKCRVVSSKGEVYIGYVRIHRRDDIAYVYSSYEQHPDDDSGFKGGQVLAMVPQYDSIQFLME